MESTKAKRFTPPYVAYKTLTNFLEKFQQGVPGRIERGLMGNLSGAVQSQLTTTLKYLHLMSDNNVPTDEMKRLVVAQGNDRIEQMKALIVKNYPFVFTADFDFSTATGSMLRERLEEQTSATGETVTRCIAFLKDAALDAGIPVSPYLSHTKKSGGGGQKKKAAPASRKNDKPPEHNTGEGGKDEQRHTQHPHIEAQSSLLLWGLFQRLPKPGSVWPKAERDQWTQTLNNVLTLEYRDKE